MEFNCSQTDSFPNSFLYEQESIRLISLTSPGLLAQIIIGILGLFNNFLLLLISYRIGWFSQNRYYLILNQAFVDFLCSLGMSVLAMRNFHFYQKSIPDLISQFDCISMEMTVCLLIKCSQRCALIVALDRTINVVFPNRWIDFGIKYRFFLISLSWIWASVQELPWFFFIDRDTCLKMCLTFTSLSQTVWRGKMVTVIDSLASIFIIVAYAVIPVSIKSMHRRVESKRKNLLIYLPRNSDENRLMLFRVRRMSFLMVTSYLCTMFVGFVVIDLLNNFVHDFELFLKLQPMATAWSLVNTVVPLYLFVWKNKQFRQESINLAKKVIETVFRISVSRKKSYTISDQISLSAKNSKY